MRVRRLQCLSAGQVTKCVETGEVEYEICVNAFDIVFIQLRRQCPYFGAAVFSAGLSFMESWGKARRQIRRLKNGGGGRKKWLRRKIGKVSDREWSGKRRTKKTNRKKMNEIEGKGKWKRCRRIMRLSKWDKPIKKGYRSMNKKRAWIEGMPPINMRKKEEKNIRIRLIERLKWH